MEQLQEILEILSEDEADALRRQCIVDRIVAFVIMAVGLNTHRTLLVHEEFQIKISNERVAAARSAKMIGRIAITDVAIEQESVVKQAGAEAEVHLHISEVAFVRSEVRTHGEVVADVAQQLVELRGDAGTGKRGEFRTASVLSGLHILRGIELIE